MLLRAPKLEGISIMTKLQHGGHITVGHKAINDYGALVKPLGQTGFTAETVRTTRPFRQTIVRFLLAGTFAFDGLFGGVVLTLSCVNCTLMVGDEKPNP